MEKMAAQVEDHSHRRLKEGEGPLLLALQALRIEPQQPLVLTNRLQEAQARLSWPLPLRTGL